MLLPSHRVVDFTSRPRHVWCGIRCSSVLSSSACKFSDEKINQIVVTLCSVSVFRDETLIFAYFWKTAKAQSVVRSICCFAFLKSKTVTIVLPGISYLIFKTTVTISSIFWYCFHWVNLWLDLPVRVKKKIREKRQEEYCCHTEL